MCWVVLESGRRNFPGTENYPRGGGFMLGRSSLSISGSWNRRRAKRDYFFPGIDWAIQSKIRGIVPGRGPG